MKNIQNKLAAARGNSPCDTIIKNAKIIDVFSSEIIESNVGITDGTIVGIGKYEGIEIIDAKDAFLVPGFVEGHIHVESTLLTIPEFAKAVLPHGTTTAVIDPHEIANVYGIDGIKYMLDSAKNCPLDIFVMLPSCVPASPFESSAAVLTADDLAKLIDNPHVAGIGELMNYPALCNGDPEFLKRAELAEQYKKIADGHSPGLTGKMLNAYILAGAQTDHECTTAQEAKEKLKLGMHVHIREGSTEHNLLELIKIVTPENSRFFSFVSDDKHPDDLLEQGHLDHSVRLAIQNGIPPLTAIQMATINTARCYRLNHIGAIAPGYQADFFLTDNLEECLPKTVYKNGKLVAEKNMCCVDTGTTPPLPGKSMEVGNLTEDSFTVKIESEKVRVIGIIEQQIITENLIEKTPQKNGRLISDTRRDLLKIAVIERHHATGRIGVGLVKGLRLKSGAIASTFAHDAHNIIVAGVNDKEMLAAVNELINIGGGYVAVENEKVVAAQPLPIGGLMCELPVEKAAEQLKNVAQAARNLGSQLDNPFMTLSFLALTPIPALRITDGGLFDATKFEMTSLGVEEVNS